MDRRQLRLAQRARTSNASTLRRSRILAEMSPDYGVTAAAAQQPPPAGDTRHISLIRLDATLLRAFEGIPRYCRGQTLLATLWPGSES